MIEKHYEEKFNKAEKNIEKVKELYPNIDEQYRNVCAWEDKECIRRLEEWLKNKKNEKEN